jgi:alpha-amylase
MPKQNNFLKAYFTKPLQVIIFTNMNTVFKPVDWACNTNIYEVNLRQYTQEGTINAFVKELPRLKDMGIKTLWLMPVHPIGKENRKGTLGSYYSIQDYTSVNPEYGSLNDFKFLVKEAQSMDFKVIIDWVANHTSWDNVWTVSNPDFFSKDENGKFRPPFPDWEDVIHLNYNNRNLRKAMIDAMKFWIIECDLDGFRCDMAHLVPLDFWHEARMELDIIKPLVWLAETEEVDYHKVFDASYTWEFLHKMEQFCRHETNIAGLESILNKYDLMFPPNALRVYFTSNHDENSHSGSEYERLNGAANTFAVLCATWNGIPLVYSGQELPNKKRLKFFDKDQIEWTGYNELHNFYKALLHLHATHPALRAGDSNVKTFRIKTGDNANVFAYLRKNGDKEVMVLLNLSQMDNLFTITDEMILGVFKNVFTNTVNDFSIQKKIEIPAWGWLVYEK